MAKKASVRGTYGRARVPLWNSNAGGGAVGRLPFTSTPPLKQANLFHEGESGTLLGRPNHPDSKVGRHLVCEKNGMDWWCGWKWCEGLRIMQVLEIRKTTPAIGHNSLDTHIET